MFDDANEAKFASHGISADQVDDVLDGLYIMVPNRKGRTGTHLIIGRDSGSACLAIPVSQTQEPEVWRPLTAWYCKASEQAKLKQAKRK
jgi:hypothetical protein